ncbi:PfkB family carbohydrate kinase [Larkinella sp. VNQ87]|uniref:PfkB family carbohydrate kinase n=1 Tax=Larkinella sp. VNQ87 TaxID=3400921 RepID=UPI003BFCEADE
MKKVVTFGEVMMRLAPPGFAKFTQAHSLNVVYGGTEANVAVSLAYFGCQTAHVTRFPDHALGQAAAATLRYHGVDTSHIRFGHGRLGLYFLETGAVSRASQIIYDRYDSAFSLLQPGDFDWKTILSGADWFHWSGITPALSQYAADCLLEAIQTANRLGVRVSGDIYFRSNLWKYGKTPQEILPDLTAGCDLVLGNQQNFEELYGVEATSFEDACRKMQQKFPRIQYFTDTERQSISASHNRLTAKLFDGSTRYSSEVYDITHIIDRIGGGDAYLAGLIYSLLATNDPQYAVEFGAAASALKHTVEGDANLVTVAEVEALVGGDSSGRLRR